MSRCNEQQAYVPDKAKIIQNAVGTALGLLFEKDKKLLALIKQKTKSIDFTHQNCPPRKVKDLSVNEKEDYLCYFDTWSAFSGHFLLSE